MKTIPRPFQALRIGNFQRIGLCAILLGVFTAIGFAAAPRDHQGAVLFIGGVKLNGPFDSATTITSFHGFRVLSTEGPLYSALTLDSPMTMADHEWEFMHSGRRLGFTLWSAGDFSFFATDWASYNRSAEVIDIISFQYFGVRTEMQILNSPVNGVYPAFGRTVVPEGGGVALFLLGCGACVALRRFLVPCKTITFALDPRLSGCWSAWMSPASSLSGRFTRRSTSLLRRARIKWKRLYLKIMRVARY